MQMSEELDRFKELQKILKEKYEIEAKKQDLPRDIETRKEGLSRDKKDYIEKNTKYEEKKSVVAKLRTELEEITRKREEAEKGMDAVSTHRDYEILEKQISENQSLEDAKRKELQEKEKNLEELKDDLSFLEQTIASNESDLAEESESIEKEVKGLTERLSELEKQEEEASAGIDPETVIKFRRIIKHNSNGIVAVRGNVCDGCHMVLPAQFANEVRHGDKILFCPYCSRILYYEESLDSENNYYSLNDDSGTADDEDLLEEDEDLIDIEDDEIEDDEIKSLDYEG